MYVPGALSTTASFAGARSVIVGVPAALDAGARARSATTTAASARAARGMLISSDDRRGGRIPRRSYGLELGDFGVAVGDAAAGPGIGGLDQAAPEHGQLAFVAGQLIGAELAPGLVQRRLHSAADLVPLLADDRDLAALRQQRRSEVVDLGRGRAASREDAEVDAHLDARRLGVADAESEFGFAHHLQFVYPVALGPTLRSAPSETSGLPRASRR